VSGTQTTGAAETVVIDEKIMAKVARRTAVKGVFIFNVGSMLGSPTE